MTEIEDLKKRIISLRQQNVKLSNINQNLRQQGMLDSQTIIKQRNQLAKYYGKLHPHQKYIALHSAVVFADGRVAFSIFTESKTLNFWRSADFRRQHVNISGKQIINMANALPYDTKVAFTRPYLRQYDGIYDDDTLIPVNHALPKQLCEYARQQLTQTITDLKSREVQDTEALIRKDNPLSEYDDNTNTLRYNSREIAVRSPVVFSNKTLAFNIYAETQEQRLFHADEVSRSHINLSRDLITGMANSAPFRTSIVFTDAHLKRYDTGLGEDTIIPIDETLPKQLCDFAVRRLGLIIKSQFQNLSEHREEV